MKNKWTGKYMRLAKQVGEDCNPCHSRKIGVVVVRVHQDGSGKILGTGYNGPPRGTPHCDDRQYLQNIFWPQLDPVEKAKAVNAAEMPADTGQTDAMMCDWVCDKYAGSKTCPRKIIGAPSGKRLELCSCLTYESRIYLADGTLVKIGELVRAKYDGQVLSYDMNSGKFVSASVTNWYELPAVADWCRIVTTTGRQGRHGFLGAKYTVDHQMLTPNGWVPVGSLRPGDEIYTAESEIPPHCRQMIYGSLLGDATITLTSGSARFVVSHGMKQAEYADYKASILGDFFKHAEDTKSSKITPFGRHYENHEMRRISSRSLRQLVQVREMAYPGGCKTISTEWLDRIDEMGLAFWYMDDGSYLKQSQASYIAAMKFADEIDEICEWFGRRFGIIARRSANSRIYFNRAATRRLHSLIAPFVPPSMRYKLSPDFRDIPAASLDLSSRRAWTDKVIQVKPVSKNSSRVRSKVFCIDVEGHHNFVTLDGIAHNCAHAETNAIVNSCDDLHGAYMFAYCGIPCFECTKLIINSGIKKVFCVKWPNDYSHGSRWLFAQAGIEIVEHDAEYYLVEEQQ